MEVSKRVGRPTLLLLIRGKTAGVPALSVRGGALRTQTRYSLPAVLP